MKNILIPTTLEPDTLTALKMLLDYSRHERTKVVLLLVSEMPFGIADMLFSAWSVDELPEEKRHVLECCRHFTETLPNSTFHIHHQVGVTNPILRNILDHYSINLTVILQSFYLDNAWINKQVFSFLVKSSSQLVCAPDKRRSQLDGQLIFAAGKRKVNTTQNNNWQKLINSRDERETSVHLPNMPIIRSDLPGKNSTFLISQRGIVAQQLLATRLGIPPGSIQYN